MISGWVQEVTEHSGTIQYVETAVPLSNWNKPQAAGVDAQKVGENEDGTAGRAGDPVIAHVGLQHGLRNGGKEDNQVGKCQWNLQRGFFCNWRMIYRMKLANSPIFWSLLKERTYSRSRPISEGFSGKSITRIQKPST